MPYQLGYALSIVILAIATVGVLGLGNEAPAWAQSCTTDHQCSGYGSARNTRCIGNTLVVQRARCVAGRCTTYNETRQVCGGSSGWRCTGGGAARRTTGRCDGLVGRCVQTTEADVCVKRCVCSNGRLSVATGACLAGSGCVRRSVVCENGCTCDPEPKCL